MSALDQAFIKAYRKQTDHWVSSHPPRRYAPPPVANQPLGVDLAHAQLFHPHVPFVAAPVAPVYATPVYATAPQAIPVAMPQAAPVGAAAVHPPAPHFAVPASNVAAAEPATLPANDAARLEPAFEVPHFRWPAMVDTLLARGSLSLARCAAELQRRAVEQHNTLLVVGCRRGIGASLITLCVGQAAAGAGLRVALVDAHLQHPNLAELLGVEVIVGWDEVLAGRQPLAEALIDSPHERLTLLPLKPRHAAQLRPFGAQSSLETLRQAYDLVLVDAGVLDSDAAATQLATLLGAGPIDDGLVVRDVARTPITQVEEVGHRLARLGIERWDLADNFG